MTVVAEPYSVPDRDNWVADNTGVVKEEIDCICECIYNILKGKIPQDEHKNKLDKYKNVLRKLVSKTKNKPRKNIIIQKGGTFLPIILSTVLGALFNSLI